MSGWKEFLSHKPSVVCAALAAIAIVLLGVVFFRFGLDATCRDDSDAAEIDDRPAAFAGENFKRVLSGEVERKKLDKPLGLIDEVMLQSNGDPEHRLMQIYGHKFLGPVSNKVARAAAKDVVQAIREQYGITLRKVRPEFRDLANWFVSTNGLRIQVVCSSNFFQKEPELELYVWSDFGRTPPVRPLVMEVMGHEIGAPTDGDGVPKKPLWKFETVVKQDSAGDNVTDGIYAVHSVSNLSLKAAIEELSEARRAVEEEYGVRLYQDADYAAFKSFSFLSRSVWIGVQLEYGRNQAIRHCVLARGYYDDLIHCSRSPENNGIFLCCLLVILLGMTALALRRTDKAGFVRCLRLYATTKGLCSRTEYASFDRVGLLQSIVLLSLAILWLSTCILACDVLPAGWRILYDKPFRMVTLWPFLAFCWLSFGWGLFILPPSVAVYIRRRRTKAQKDATMELKEVLPACPRAFASPVFRGVLGIVAFFCGAAICYVMQGGRIDDPIVKRSIPFLGDWLSVAFGLMCSMSAVALSKIRLPRGIIANTNTVLAILLLAFLIHLEDAFVWCGYNMTFTACVGGFANRLSKFFWLFVCACFVLGIFFAVLRCFPIVRRILAHCELTESSYLKRLLSLMGWVALLGFLVYELLILITYVSRSWWAGA